jgi:GNAT superfamily N-acetyltransferase
MANRGGRRVTRTRGLPAGLTVRAPERADAEAVTAMLRRSEEAIQGVADVDLEDVLADWSRPSFDLAGDAVLVVDGDRLVGYAEAFLARRRAEVCVDPDARGRGIGAALLRWTEERAIIGGVHELGQTVSDADAAALDLLRRNGYQTRWTSWILEIGLRDVDPDGDPGLPAGIELGALDPADDAASRAVHGLIDTAFSEWPDAHETTYEDWRAESLERTARWPGDVLLALEDGAPVGVALCLRYDDAFWVQQLAVRRSHRGRGVGRGLLRTAFARGRREGYELAGLSTDSRTGALALYERVGMRVARSFTHRRKRFDPPA